jgi:TonB family protein
MLRLAFGLAALLWATHAWAADQAEYAPPGAWVKAVDIPEPSADSKTDIQILLEDFQNNFGADGDDYYEEIAERIQTPQGLDRVGSVVLGWRPDTETLVIHKLRIIRDGQVIDVLANGQKFLVLRRENNLEMAMLDGALTAAIQPEGLQVGDTLDLAFTLQDRDPLFKGRSQLFMRNPGLMPIRHLHIRESWPNSKSLQWRQTEGLAPAKVTDTADGKELLIDMTDTQLIKPPRDAPGRFSNVNSLEISEFPAWADVSALMAPLYDKAAQLTADSPIKAEAAKIAAASPDPKIRAAAALRLVQDRVRYLFLGMDRGGYIPADADRTWTRRFGDCKGKTVLLLALLHELGIEAQPAIVNSGGGDGLDAVLPMVRAFDHVLVRARIDGKIYWLDGTRTGDRELDDIAIPRFSWALPLQASGAVLEKLESKPFDKPETLTTLRVDASAGLDAPAPAHAEQVLRGDDAIGMKLGLSGKSPSEVESYLRHFWADEYDSIDINHVAFTFDEAAGEAHLSMDGTTKMSWKIYRGDAGRQYRIEGSRLGWTADYERDPGPHKDAPFNVKFPYFEKTVETVVLPQGGQGFTIEGADVDKVIGGFEFKRTSRVAKNIFTMSASVRSVASEFPAAAAPAAKTALKDMSDVAVYLHASASLDAASPPDSGTKPGGDLLRARASEAMARGDLNASLKALDQAVVLAPTDATLLASRAYVKLGKRDIPSASADIEKAITLAPNSLPIQGMQVAVYLAEKRFSDASTLADRMVKANPNNAEPLVLRGRVFAAQGDFVPALSDYDAAVRIAPDASDARYERASLFVGKHDFSHALADVDKLVALAPDNAQSHDLRGYVLKMMGRPAEAVIEYNAALAIKPSAETYVRLAEAQSRDGGDQTLAALNQALKLQPNLIAARLRRAVIFLDEAKFDDALADLDAAVAIAPGDTDAGRMRAAALAGRHDYDAAIAQIGRLLAERPNEADLLTESCRYKAAKGRDSAVAGLADCLQATRIAPEADDFLLTTAFAYQRAGKLDIARETYDAVLSRRPNSAVAHFGRGLAEIESGSADKGKADLVQARGIYSSIDAHVASFMWAPSAYRADAPEMAALQKAAHIETYEEKAKANAAKAGTVVFKPSDNRTPRKPISIVTPIYPAIAEDYQIEGYVDFEFIVEPDGSVGEPKVENEAPEIFGFADAALKVFSKWKFTPEIVDGKAVATHAFYRFSFKLAN